MLVLSRKLSEEIRIGNEVIIKVISISENQVKIGIEAPSEVKVYRAEIYEKIRQNTIEASLQSREKADTDLTKLKVNKFSAKSNEG